MPLVTKAKRLTTRQRTTVRERGDRARNPEQRRQWEVAARYEHLFSNLFRTLLRNLRKDLQIHVRRSLKSPNASIETRLQAIPFFDEADPFTFPIWDRFAKGLERAYKKVVIGAAEAGAKAQGWKFVVAKQDEIIFNPEVVRFIRRRSLRRAKELSEDVRGTIRAILTEGLESGLSEAGRAGIALEIEQHIGLTEGMHRRVMNRAQGMKGAGFRRAEIEAAKVKFTKELISQRAEAIARTETLDAQTEGLKALWQQGQEAGIVPPGSMKKWVATNDERLSDICEELGQHDPVPLGQNFDSSIVGPVDGPPAHPNCRSTLVLVLPEE